MTLVTCLGPGPSQVVMRQHPDGRVTYATQGLQLDQSRVIEAASKMWQTQPACLDYIVTHILAEFFDQVTQET